MSQNIERFGKYILLEKLGGGGMAEVFLAKSPGAGGIAKFIAVKRIQPQYSSDPEFIDMFKDEAKIAVNLKHNNVLSIYEFGVENNQFYIVMDFVEGRNLRQLLNHFSKLNTGFSTEHIVYIIREVAAGLDYAHRCLDGTTGRPLNIIHRDISPQNVMVTFEGEVKIIDFGIAKAESQLETTRAGTLKGKFGYMSPEQAEGMTIDQRTDIFSLGIVLWELLANNRLFASTDEVNTLRKIRDCNIPSLRKINPNIDPELERICKKALTKDRNLRYQSSAELHKDLSRFLNMKYAEFSTQDFTRFLKEHYSSLIMENRKKLVEFAKIQVTPPPPRAKSAREDTATLTKSGEKKLAAPDLPDNLLLNKSNLPEFDIESLKKVNTEIDVKKMIVPHVEGTNPRMQTINKTTSRVQTRSRVSQERQSSISRGNYPMHKSRAMRGSFLMAVSLAAVVGAFVFYFVSSLGPEIGNLTKKPASVDVSSKPSGNVAVTMNSETETQTFALSLQSDPAGAEIYINGQPSGHSTPSMIRLKANEKAVLSLRKDGYLPYERIITLTGNATLPTTLMKSQAGYIDIKASIAGENPVLTINGRRLLEPLPISNYAVPSNERLVIRLDNPFAQICDEKVVMIKTGEKLSLHLIPQYPINEGRCDRSASEKNRQPARAKN